MNINSPNMDTAVWLSFMPVAFDFAQRRQLDISEHARHHSITMIDTLAIYEMLNAAGFQPRQAEAITRAIAASKVATLELKAGRTNEQRGASTAPAVEQCSVRLHESIRSNTRDMIQFIVGGHILLLIALIALVDFSQQ